MDFHGPFGAPEVNLTSHSAGTELVRHPGYQERIVVMADYHCEAGIAHILVDQPMTASGATPG